jgi:hypothetical protein
MSKKSKSKNRIANVVSRIDPNQLNQLYQNSISTTPELHHPGIVARTASEDHVRRDFNTWFAGVQSGLLVCSQISRTTGMQQQPQVGGLQQPQVGAPVYDLFRRDVAQAPLFAMPTQTRVPGNIHQALQMAINTLSTRSRVAA